MSVTDRLEALARSLAGPTRDHGRANELVRLGRVELQPAPPGRLAAVISEPSGQTSIVVDAPPLDVDAWQRLVDGLASSLEHVALVGEGRLPAPETLEELAGAPLVPDVDDVAATPGDPVLAAAVIIRVARTLPADVDPLLAWRGRTGADVCSAVRAARTPSSHVVTEADVADPTAAPHQPPRLSLTLAPPVEPEALVRSLGPAPVSGVDETVRGAAEFAWQVAAGAGEEAASDAVLLAELRARGAVTAAQLAERLGIDEDVVAATLADLHSDGRVLRAGERYRAA